MTTKEMIEIMQAYERGEQIECKTEGYEESAWEMVESPLWNWGILEYRVKPKPAYRPYKNIQELLQAQKEHGMNIRLKVKGCNYYRLPLYITDTLIGVQCPQSDGSVVNIDASYEDLLRDYIWQDGTPCGIEK